MAKRKTEFELQFPGIPRPKLSGRVILMESKQKDLDEVWIRIDKPKILAVLPDNEAFDLAIAILKALKSKNLKKIRDVLRKMSKRITRM